MPMMLLREEQVGQHRFGPEELNPIEAMLIAQLEEKAKDDPRIMQRFEMAMTRMPGKATRAEVYEHLRREFSDVVIGLPKDATAFSGLVDGLKEAMPYMLAGGAGAGALFWGAGKAAARPGLVGTLGAGAARALGSKYLAGTAGFFMLLDVMRRLGEMHHRFSRQDYYSVGKLMGNVLAEGLGMVAGHRVARKHRTRIKQTEAPPTQAQAQAASAEAEAVAQREAAEQAQAVRPAEPQQAPQPSAPPAELPPAQEVVDRLQQVKDQIAKSKLPDETKQVLSELADRLAQAQRGQIPNPIERPVPKTRTPPAVGAAQAKRAAKADKPKATRRAPPAAAQAEKPEAPRRKSPPTGKTAQTAPARAPEPEQPVEPTARAVPEATAQAEAAPPAPQPTVEAAQKQVEVELENILKELGAEVVGKLPEPAPRPARRTKRPPSR